MKQPFLDLPVFPVNEAEKLQEGRHILYEVHVCMCVRVQSLKATRVLSCLGPEYLKPPSYRPLTYHGAVPGHPESCCAALGQPNTPAAKRTFGWVAIDEVAIAHEQGHGDNRRTSL